MTIWNEELGIVLIKQEEVSSRCDGLALCGFPIIYGFSKPNTILPPIGKGSRMADHPSNERNAAIDVVTQVQSRSRRRRAPAAQRCMRILVVDDHEGFRDEVTGILSRNGHYVEGVGTAADAIPIAENGNFDFVLVDYQMPEHDGIWFMRNVSLPERTRALLVTAHTSRYVIHTMFTVGASGYIIQPFSEKELLRHLAFHSR